jgi:hypothetical protein
VLGLGVGGHAADDRGDADWDFDGGRYDVDGHVQTLDVEGDGRG